MDRINVTKTYLPPLEEYEAYLKQIWASGQLTNQGPLLHNLETKLEKYLDVKNLHFVTNGTLALQLALRALDITEGEIITTPFSYVATTSAILWERCTPVFVDIEPESLCIDPEKIEAAITEDTKAILAVHVFGYPCDVEAIEAIATKHNIKVIYDGAHAFGVEYKGKSLLSYGDCSMCSFHSTKVFHTIEGGCLITRDAAVGERIELIKRFGHNQDDHYMLGMNSKASEFQAAMGLCNLEHVDELIIERRRVTEQYDSLLGDAVERRGTRDQTKPNYAYYPIILKNEDELMKVTAGLNNSGVFPRRYFYPSLNTLPYLKDRTDCPISEDIASRILCLPLYADLKEDIIANICKVVKNEIAA